MIWTFWRRSDREGHGHDFHTDLLALPGRVIKCADFGGVEFEAPLRRSRELNTSNVCTLLPGRANGSV